MISSQSSIDTLHSLPKAKEAFAHFIKTTDQLILTRNAHEVGRILDNIITYIEYLYVNEEEGKKIRNTWHRGIWEVLLAAIVDNLPQISSRYHKETKYLKTFEDVGEWVDHHILLHIPNPSDAFKNIRDRMITVVEKIANENNL